MAKNKRLVFIFSAILLILLIPFVAMFFTSEVKWNYADFIAAGILLTVAGLGIEGTLRIVQTPSQKIVVLSGALVILILLWMEMAVGLFNTPLAGN